MPARRKVANRPSRNWTGMARGGAISPIGTGPAPPLRASSASARTAYGDFDVMASTGRRSLGYACVAAAHLEARSVGPAARAHGDHLRALGAAGPELGARHDRPDRPQ